MRKLSFKPYYTGLELIGSGRQSSSVALIFPHSCAQLGTSGQRYLAFYIEVAFPVLGHTEPVTSVRLT